MSENYTTLEDSPQMLKHFEIAGIETEEDKGGESTSGTSTESSTESTSGKDATDKVEGAPGKDSLSSKPDGRTKQGKEEKGKDTSDPNDLKLADGSVVKAGQERRWYERGKITEQKLTNTQAQLNTITQARDTLKTKYDELASTVSKIGLEKPEQVNDAITLYKDLARDPVGTMTKLLAELKGMGHSFEGIGGAVDTLAIQAHIDRKLPTSEERKVPTKEEIDNEAAQEVATFITQYPDAVTQETHIAALMDRSQEAGKPLSLEQAYFALKERVVDAGFDWSKPLSPQIEARKAAAAGAAPKVETKPRTSGRTAVDNNPIDPSKVVNPERDLDSDSIVRAAMKENGFDL